MGTAKVFLSIIIVFLVAEYNISQNKYPLSNQINQSTVKIDLIEGGKIIGSGSGFVVGFTLSDSIRVPCLISNKHVFQVVDTVLLTFNGEIDNQSAQDSAIIRTIVDLNLYKVIPHPNIDIDLAALPLSPIEYQLNKKKFRIKYKVITEDLIPTKEDQGKFNVVNDILLVGYPIGLSDTSHNNPIFRKGITATSPTVRYNNQNIFLIDAACFPGSSGSPVFLIGSEIQRRPNQIMFAETLYLLGILYAGIEYPVEGDIKVVQIPNKLDLKSVTRVPINLGAVINAEELFKIKDEISSLLENYR